MDTLDIIEAIDFTNDIAPVIVATTPLPENTPLPEVARRLPALPRFERLLAAMRGEEDLTTLDLRGLGEGCTVAFWTGFFMTAEEIEPGCTTEGGLAQAVWEAIEAAIDEAGHAASANLRSMSVMSMRGALAAREAIAG